MTRRDDRTRAHDLLRDMLSNGPRMAKDVTAEANRLGISTWTLRMARKDLGVEHHQPGNTEGQRGCGPVWLSLPGSKRKQPPSQPQKSQGRWVVGPGETHKIIVKRSKHVIVWDPNTEKWVEE